MSENTSDIPINLDEAVSRLIDRLAPEARDTLRNPDCKKEDPALGHWLHMNLGMSLRNDWGLWGGGPLKDWFVSRGLFHPDDMSGVIIDCALAHLQGRPFDLDAEVRKYQTYWAGLNAGDGVTRVTVTRAGEVSAVLESPNSGVSSVIIGQISTIVDRDPGDEH